MTLSQQQFLKLSHGDVAVFTFVWPKTITPVKIMAGVSTECSFPDPFTWSAITVWEGHHLNNPAKIRLEGKHAL